MWTSCFAECILAFDLLQMIRNIPNKDGGTRCSFMSYILSAFLGNRDPTEGGYLGNHLGRLEPLDALKNPIFIC